MKTKTPKHDIANMVSIVSHQLKTPLSITKGYLEVLAGEELGKLNAKQKEYLNDATKNNDRMIKLVRDLLDVSRIEEGRMVLRLRKTNLVKVVEQVIDNYQTLASANNCLI